MNNQKKNKFLIVIDGSYFQYFTLFGAISEFKKKFVDEANYWIKPVEECDQENLPNLLNCDTFKRVLKTQVMKRLETVDYIAKQNFQDAIDMSDSIDIVFAMDDNLKNNFRLAAYEQYKAQRVLQKRQFQLKPIKDYIVDVIFKELDVEKEYDYNLVKVEGAEGDDVIATILLKFKDNYVDSILLASDHDYLQIPNINEFDLYGRKIECTLGDEPVTSEEFLLGKILMGDKSDNIQQVFAKCGPKTALKFVKNREALKNLLKENQECANRFILNKKIISFKEIPEDLTNHIYEKINEILYKNDVLNKPVINLKDFMNL